MAHRVTGDPRYADEVRDQLRGWIAANPVEYGVNWACTMDVGIRAANWVVALALLPPAPWVDEIAASLLLHGRFIRSHLETHVARGNHYLSDVAGLIVVAALFHGGAEGRAWADWASGELEAEMAHQVRPDGADHEMSLAYHRLVAELFLHGSQVAEALAPGRLTPAFHARLGRMLDLMAAVARTDGLTPVAGDADDGRFLPLGDHGAADPRAHLGLLARADRDPVPATGHAAFAAGGWWVMRAGGAYVLARCGDVGLGGEGAHAHNDLLSFELALGGQPLVVDPGSYVYTADAASRNRFRSTGAHATLRIGGAEQRPLPPGRLFALPDTAPQRLVAWEPQAGGGARWTAEHEGFPELPGRTRHRRTLELAGDGTTLTVTDEVELGAPAPLEWSFPLAAGTASADAGGVTARIGGVELRIGAEGVAWAVETGQVSPRYGVAVEAPVARARATRPAGATTVTFRLRPEPRG
jgi:uncharacterized heparinase superfamily protein